MPDPKKHEYKMVTGFDVYHWPEFKAFAERLGIEYELLTTNVTITIPVEGVVVIAHDYHGRDRHLPQESDA
jgi:hypothetical protein